MNIDNFMILASEIYPPSLYLRQKNKDRSRADVLDMHVSLAGGIVTTKVYCKADAFLFHVISLPFLESNIDTAICYRTFYGQTVRFERLCTHKADFEDRVRFLMGIFKDRNYDVRLLGRQFCRAVEKYISVFQRWEIPVNMGDWFKSILDSGP